MSSPARARLRELAAHPALRGIAITHCVVGDGWGPKEAGHVHFGEQGRGGRRSGWICLLDGSHFNATTVCHEIAHLVCGNMRHDDRWRRAVHSLGGRVERKYRKVKR